MKYFLVILILLISYTGYGQEESAQDDVKIGLVLSGGGAKGLAHIGALKVIDRLGIRVDYVAGTSMGAIVGSLYASGYSGEELDSIFQRINFDDIINDNLPRSIKSFYERENTERYVASLPVEKWRVKLPSALSRGQNTYNLLSRLTIPVSDIDDFSKLPIPFFCLATDIESGTAVILDHGSLVQSVMASGALPSLFQPVVINDKVLIDGGVVNNYPIDELKAKGMDIIIGVDVQDSLATRDDLRSAPDILLQINNYRTINDMKAKSKKTDIYIKPNIKDFTVVSFDDGEEIIQTGVEAALEHYDQLITVKQKQSKFKEIIEPKKIPDTLTIVGVSIDGNENYTRSYIMGKLKIKTGQKMSYDKFQNGINNLVASNNFDSFYYQLRPADQEGEYNLETRVIETKKTTFIKLALHYDNLYKSAILFNITKKRLLSKNDAVSLDLGLGDNIRYNFEYFIDKGFYWSVGFNSRFNQFNRGIEAASILSEEQVFSTGLNKLDIKLNDFTNQFYLQTLFRKDFALSLGAELKHLTIKSETISDDEDHNERIFENSNYFSLFGNLKLDTYNNKYFPHSGLYFDGDFHWYLYSSDYNNDFDQFSIGKARIGFAQKIVNPLFANIELEGGFRIGDNNSPYLNFALGGYGNDLINNFIPFYGYDFVSIAGDGFVKANLTLDYQLFEKHHLNFSANYANVEDNIFGTGEWATLPDYSGYAIGYGFESFLGPLEVKYTWSPELNESIWFFSLGFWF